MADDYPSMAVEFVDALWDVARRHRCREAGMHGLLAWIEERLSLLEEHEAILKEAALPPDPRFSSPKQPERSGFAAKLRQGQALSASQAMVLMGERLRRALEENQRLASLLRGVEDARAGRLLSNEEMWNEGRSDAAEDQP